MPASLPPPDASQLTRIEARDLCFFYGERQALHHIDMRVQASQVTALIGPSGCGKSTFLRVLNRMNDTVPNTRATGAVLFDGNDVLGADVDVVALRRRVGMVFQKPQPFPASIAENIAYGARASGVSDRREIAELVETSLRRAAIWDEVKDRLSASALSLSGGQQQRLCVARALAVRPEVLLLDEPTSALDPIATAKLEELIHELRRTLTIVMVTHSMQQAARVSQKTAFFYMGKLIEIGDTQSVFTRPTQKQTEDYITGRFG